MKATEIVSVLCKYLLLKCLLHILQLHNFPKVDLLQTLHINPPIFPTLLKIRSSSSPGQHSHSTHFSFHINLEAQKWVLMQLSGNLFYPKYHRVGQRQLPSAFFTPLVLPPVFPFLLCQAWNRQQELGMDMRKWFLPFFYTCGSHSWLLLTWLQY